MDKPVLRPAVLLLIIMIFFSCSARREARRNAQEEIRIMPSEEMAVHPLVTQIKEFEAQLEDLQAVLNGEDPEKALAEANASIRKMRRDIADLENTLESTDGELRSLGRSFERQIDLMGDKP